MKLLSRLFGRRASVGPTADVDPLTPASAPTPTLLRFGAVGDRFVRIPSLDFFGQYSRSPNGKWLIAWRDSNDAGTHGGHRESGPGRFYLFHGEKLAAQGRAERPQDAKVGNDGTFVLNDWRFGSGLNGTFLAYRNDGTLILKRDFAANLLNNGIADDGGMAACQTANAPHSPDSSVLAVFDLRAGREIAAWVPESGWADTYSFAGSNATMRLHYRDGTSFAFTLDGQFVERDAWIRSRTHSANIYVLANLLREADDPIPAELAQSILTGAQAAMAEPDFDERQRAMALKVCGLCHEALGNKSEALASFEEAVQLDPKIGLKRRATQLRRELP